MKKNKKQMPLQNGEELKPIMIKPSMGRMIKPMAKFPDLSGDGKVTQKDILMGRGVIKKPKIKKNSQKFFDDKGREIQVLSEVTKKGRTTQSELEDQFSKFKRGGVGGFKAKDITKENFSKLMKDKTFNQAAKKDPYYKGLKQAYRANRGF